MQSVANFCSNKYCFLNFFIYSLPFSNFILIYMINYSFINDLCVFFCPKGKIPTKQDEVWIMNRLIKQLTDMGFPVRYCVIVHYTFIVLTWDTINILHWEIENTEKDKIYTQYKYIDTILMHSKNLELYRLGPGDICV